MLLKEGWKITAAVEASRDVQEKVEEVVGGESRQDSRRFGV